MRILRDYSGILVFLSPHNQWTPDMKSFIFIFKQTKSKILKINRELSKLQLKAKKYGNNYELTEYDVTEMKRRIEIFKDKWDKILWIKHYHEINNETPTKQQIALELGLSLPLSSIYLEYYHDMDRYKDKDLEALFCNFNVYDDCILWWYLIITSLKTYSSKAMWLIFAKVALIAPHKISIELLQKYQKDLTRFDANELNKVTQQIVIGSRYPICTALQIAKWFQDRAKLDIARGVIYILLNNGHSLYFLTNIKSEKRKSCNKCFLFLCFIFS